MNCIGVINISSVGPKLFGCIQFSIKSLSALLLRRFLGICKNFWKVSPDLVFKFLKLLELRGKFSLKIL